MSGSYRELIADPATPIRSMNDRIKYLERRVRTLSPAAAPPGWPVTVTSLPASPADGQECFLLVDSTHGVVWHLRYRSSSASSFKWEKVGGAPFIVYQTANFTGATIGGSWRAVTGCVWAPSWAGDYMLSGGVDVGTGVTGNVELHVQDGTTFWALGSGAAYNGQSYRVAAAPRPATLITSRSPQLYVAAPGQTLTGVSGSGGHLIIDPIRIG